MVQGPPSTPERVSRDDVVARRLSFDRNHDGKVEASELVDRMVRSISPRSSV